MSLILGVTPCCDWQALQPLFEQAEWPLRSDNSEAWYQAGMEPSNDDNRYLLIHNRPEEAVASALSKGQRPGQVLQSWLTAAQAMVNFYKYHRNQAVMVHLAHMKVRPASMLEAVAGSLDLPINNAPKGPVPDKEPANELYMLMACQFVRQTPDIDHILAQLEACALPLEGHPYGEPPVNLEEVMGQFAAMEKKGTERQNELSALENRLQETVRQLHEKDKQIAEQREQLEEQAACKQKAEEEAVLLLEQLHRIQEEIERQLLDNQKQASINVENEEKLVSLGKKLERVTAQQQAEAKAKNRLNEELEETQKQLASLQYAQKENELLLEQLHLIQEELEVQFNTRQRLEVELNRFKSSEARREAGSNRKDIATDKASKSPFFCSNPEKKALKRQMALVKKSGLFDKDWYLKMYPDVAEKGMDPIKHYLKFGAGERRNPGPMFDTGWYLNRYPDVAKDGMNPLVHYIKFGRQEGRATGRHHRPSSGKA